MRKVVAVLGCGATGADAMLGGAPPPPPPGGFGGSPGGFGGPPVYRLGGQPAGKPSKSTRAWAVAKHACKNPVVGATLRMSADHLRQTDEQQAQG